MPLFFFDFRQGADFIADAVGIEFANVEEAYLEVAKAVEEMWSELLIQRRDPRLCSFEVRNQSGDTLFIFPFEELLDSCKDRPLAKVS